MSTKIQAIYSLEPDELIVPRGEFAIPCGHSALLFGDVHQDWIKLSDILLEHPKTAALVRVSGESMIDARINSGDWLIVDRAVDFNLVEEKIVIAIINGEFVVKQLKRRNRRLYLVPKNKDYATREIKDHEDFVIWAVVKYIIHGV